jgi:hypothetical protein
MDEPAPRGTADDTVVAVLGLHPLSAVEGAARAAPAGAPVTRSW